MLQRKLLQDAEPRRVGRRGAGLGRPRTVGRAHRTMERRAVAERATGTVWTVRSDPRTIDQSR
jgi:hypothetical protein